MTLILDAGAMLAFEKGDKLVRSALERASRSGVQVRTASGAVAQVWEADRDRHASRCSYVEWTRRS